MTAAAQGDPPTALPLGNLPPYLFQQEVLRRLGPRALAMFARASHGCAAAVAATALMTWAYHTKRTVTGRIFHHPPLCLEVACSHAARCGNREVLEWLHDTGCPWNVKTTCAAAGAGHLEVVKWLHNQGCPWDVWTCAYAARSEHLPFLQWAREHLCPWNWATPACAAQGGHLEVL